MFSDTFFKITNLCRGITVSCRVRSSAGVSFAIFSIGVGFFIFTKSADTACYIT